jgi:VWFA-related protein
MRTPPRLLVLGLLLLPVALAGQAPAPGSLDQPVFRAEITFIEVDVFVTDRNGAFVRDLSKDDFEVLQDGQPRDVTSFAFVDLPLPERRPGLAAIADSPRSTGNPGDGRVYALLLDSPMVIGPTRGTENEAIRRIQRVATQFLDEAFTEDDRMSVVHVQSSGTPVQDLTSSRPHLRSAIGALGTLIQPASMQLLGRQLQVRATLNGYRALEETAERLGAIDGRRKAILWVGGRASFNPGDMGNDAAEMSAIMFAHRDAVRAAARNNVAIYPIDPDGLNTSTGARELNRVGGLREVANDTGGIALLNTNNFSGGFERIVRDNSTYYLLGFYPEIDQRDGRFHEITVRVNRPGVNVRARRGFFAPEGRAPVIDTAPRSPTALAVDALGNMNFREPLLLRTAAWSPDAGAPSGAVWLVAEVDAQTRREPRWASGGTAEVVVLATGGDQAFSQTVDVSGPTLSFALRAPADGGLAPGAYTVRVQMRGTATASLTEMIRVVIPEGHASLGEAVLWRRGPSTGPRHVQTADPRFRRNELLRLELPTTSDEPASARLLNREGDPMPIPVQVSDRQENGTRWIVVDATLSPLAQSDYAIEVTQGEATQVTAFRMVP